MLAPICVLLAAFAAAGPLDLPKGDVKVELEETIPGPGFSRFTTNLE